MRVYLLVEFVQFFFSHLFFVPVSVVHMKNLEDLTVNENATYFVEVFTNETTANESLCSVESFLKKTSSPVFMVLIFLNSSLGNLTFSRELEKSYENFVTIAFDSNSFFNKTLFANLQTNDPKFLTFLAKVLVSWNVGGTVLDTRMRTLRDRSSIFGPSDKGVTVGTFGNEVVLISAKRFCHAFIFDVLKTVAETRNVIRYTQVDVIEAARKRFCRGKWNCGGVKMLPGSIICTSREKNDTCTFLIPKLPESETAASINLQWEQLCPLVKSLL